MISALQHPNPCKVVWMLCWRKPINACVRVHGKQLPVPCSIWWVNIFLLSEAFCKILDAIIGLMLIGKHHIVSVSELAILMFLVNFSSLLVMFRQIRKLFNLVNNIFFICRRHFVDGQTYICFCRSLFLLNFLYSFYHFEYIIASLFGFIWDSARPMFCKREEVFPRWLIQNWGQSILQGRLWWY